MTTVDELLASMEEALVKLFGYTSFRDGQFDAIVTLLIDRDLLAVMPTGSGKSLIYQFVAMVKPGLTVVISPLIALMKDQVDGLVERGIPATFINSTLSPQEQSERLEQLAEGAFKLVYVAPERLRQYFFQAEILELDVSLLVVDEAHCISHWGHDFRPDYLYISQFCEAIGDPTVVALTATATNQVRQEIISSLRLDSPELIIQSFDRDNISLHVNHISNENSFVRSRAKLSMVADLLNEWNLGAAIVYVGTRSDAEKVAWFLREKVGVPAQYYHAGMETYERDKVQEWFAHGVSPIIVATNAFGMGIDRADVRLIVHHQIPGSIEAYYQEIGRAGRDGKPAKAILLFHPDDRNLHDYFIENSNLSFGDLQGIFNLLLQLASGNHALWVNHKTISDLCGYDEEGVKVRVGLRRLEEARAIEQSYYEGVNQLIYLKSWNDGLVWHVVNQIELHTQHRKFLLDRVLEYAGKKSICRRKMILEYFDDSTLLNANSFPCCDVCQPPLFITYNSLARAILETVADHPGRFARFEIASYLQGTLGIGGRHSGRLSHIQQRKILRELNRLLKTNAIKRKGSGRLILPQMRQPAKTIARSHRTEHQHYLTNAVEISEGIFNKDEVAKLKKQIVSSARQLNGELTIKMLAAVLVGSSSSRVSNYRYGHEFGLLAKYRRKVIQELIHGLIQEKRLKLNANHRVIVIR